MDADKDKAQRVLFKAILFPFSLSFPHQLEENLPNGTYRQEKMCFARTAAPRKCLSNTRKMRVELDITNHCSQKNHVKS
jgi:hypothetical protein